MSSPYKSFLDQSLVMVVSTARCSSSRNSLRGITHSHILLKGVATSRFKGIFDVVVVLGTRRCLIYARRFFHYCTFVIA